MKEAFLEFAACPSCGRKLRLGGNRVTGVGGEIRSGSLECEMCRTAYPIRNYIPRFVSSDNYAASYGLEWKLHRRTQLDRFSGHSISRERFYRTTHWPTNLVGTRVLEAGCGAGRFTEIALGTGCELVSFDLSESVDACLENHGVMPSWHLFQGDLYHLPLKHAQFDAVFCMGVLQNCPNPGKAFEALLGPLRPGGRFAIDVFERHWKVYATPRFLLRMVLPRIRPERTYRLVQWAVPKLFPIKRWLKRRIPAVGRYLATMVPVFSHEDLLPLRPEQIQEWAILDTFNTFAARNENRASEAEVREWLRGAGLFETEVESGGELIIARGTTPNNSAPAPRTPLTVGLTAP